MMQRDPGARLIGLLAEPDRLRVVAALVLGARSWDEVADQTGLNARALTRAMNKLIDGGLVSETEEGYAFEAGVLHQAARSAGRRRAEAEGQGSPANDVLSRFFKGGRLTSLPAARSKRIALLNHIAQEFEPGRYYEEREVNRILKRYHDDYASLRRYLVDEGFLSREAGKYWRTGGSVET